MQDGSFSVNGRHGVKGSGVAQLAVDVVARLVERDETRGQVLKEAMVLRLLDAVRTPDLGAFRALQPELKRARISAARLADCYIPEVARRLGVEWVEDTASFAEVTMCVARLQTILRDIGAGWTADDADKDGVLTMLLILPAREQHTLGAMVISGWLRRRGISVCLRIAPTLRELSDLMSVRHFDGVMISLAVPERLDTCASLVSAIRKSARHDLRVAVGGAVLERGEDVVAATGADIVTNDLNDALEGLGLTRPRQLMTVIT